MVAGPSAEAAATCPQARKRWGASGRAAAAVIPGPGWAASGAASVGGGGGGFQQPGVAVFTLARSHLAKVMDALLAFREIGNQQPGAVAAAGAAPTVPAACLGAAPPQPAGPPPNKVSKAGGAGGATPSTAGGHVRGVTGPGGVPQPSRTPASRSSPAGDAGAGAGAGAGAAGRMTCALPTAPCMCRQLAIPAPPAAPALRTDGTTYDCGLLLSVMKRILPHAVASGIIHVCRWLALYVVAR
ncbi:hypothetical protein HYH02_014639 [Chlamydomonas schloesseri]|uniref:Uncharacterized protein n=1 Tax=Chlamydomonas schloesseri TaxID=2026947 RepID=A0A835SV95_9CHLO|nr:hypothetical protein HYH02_014639 [Chlamydomonas schloesseri]|eukprot:KAG2427235.1 hypothetical protein HYH02_014639 [Chlamydomonas schloesseri]